MRFGEYAAGWKAGQRDLGPASMVHLESLLDARRLGLYEDSPVEGVKAARYDPERVVISSPEQLREIRCAGDDSFRLVADLMSGCGMRNGEAFAVNVNSLVAGNVYRITEQVNRTRQGYERLKHRRPGDYRDVPLPARTRRTIEWYADRHGTTDGYLPRHPGDASRVFPHCHIANQWKRIKKTGRVCIPERMVVYSFRHFFALNCLTHNIPITDVAEWMGHKTIGVTFQFYRHLMPGSITQAANILDLDLTA